MGNAKHPPIIEGGSCRLTSPYYGIRDDLDHVTVDEMENQLRDIEDAGNGFFRYLPELRAGEENPEQGV